jgi:hypothetical protein
MDKQTKDQIIAEQRAADAARNSAVWNALKRTPGLLAGGTVDLANLVLGAVTGKGMAGLVKKPVGGSESINEAFGMPASKDAFQQGVEAATGMLSPGGAAKAIIIPAALAKMTIKEMKSAQSLINSGKADEAYKTHKVYEDPVSGELLKVIPDTNAKLSNQKFQIFTAASDKGTPTPLTVSMGVTAPQTTLAEGLLHPELYATMPDIGSTLLGAYTQRKMGGIKDYADAQSAHFVPGNVGRPPQIAAGMTTKYTGNLQSQNPMTAMVSNILHETQHAVQNKTGMPQGGTATQFLADSNRINRAQKEIEAQWTTGKKATGYARSVMERVTDEAFDLYKNLPGEVQSRLVELQYVTGDYDTHPLVLYQQLGGDLTKMLKAESRPKLDLDPEVQKILDIYAPRAGNQP